MMAETMLMSKSNGLHPSSNGIHTNGLHSSSSVIHTNGLHSSSNDVNTNGLHSSSNGVHTNGSHTPSKEVEAYNVVRATEQVFRNGVLSNPLINKYLPKEYEKYVAPISFKGTRLPSIPIYWRFAESVGALKALEGTYVNALLSKKYGVDPQRIIIDIDHAQLYFMSHMIVRIPVISNGKEVHVVFGSFTDERKDVAHALFPHCDIYNSLGTPMNSCTTNIHKTSDGRYYYLHGSLNPKISMECIGIPPGTETDTFEEAIAIFTEKMGQISSSEIDKRQNDECRQAGSIAYTIDEFKNSEHGKANEHVQLFEIHPGPPDPAQKACWWKSQPHTGPARPLAGLKVVDITRVIAAPAVTRGLAEHGASVMRVTAPHLPDLESLHPDLNWGKWNCHLDFRKEEDREKLKELIKDADVVVTGYRPGVMEKWGFGPEDVFELCKGRDRGIIYARENGYGWYGPWKDRSGWQQVADACCGISWEFGKAMGLDEPVTPVFPNSDYCTGLAGVCGILAALIQRGEKGGSYTVDLALNYYSQWLINSVGTYSPAVWKDVWGRNGNKVVRYYDNRLKTVPTYMKMLMAPGAPGNALFKDEYFEERDCKYLSERTGAKVTMFAVKPMLQFPDGLVKPGYTVSTRGNGADAAKWPEDLTVDWVR